MPVGVVVDLAADGLVVRRVAVGEAIDHEHVEEAVAVIESLVLDPEGEVDGIGRAHLAVGGDEAEHMLALREAGEREVDGAGGVVDLPRAGGDRRAIEARAHSGGGRTVVRRADVDAHLHVTGRAHPPAPARPPAHGDLLGDELRAELALGELQRGVHLAADDLAVFAGGIERPVAVDDQLVAVEDAALELRARRELRLEAAARLRHRQRVRLPVGELTGELHVVAAAAVADGQRAIALREGRALIEDDRCRLLAAVGRDAGLVVDGDACLRHGGGRRGRRIVLARRARGGGGSEERDEAGDEEWKRGAA